MLRFAIDFDGPVAIRYPRGTAYDSFEEHRAPIEYGKCEMISEGCDIAILSVGHMFEETVKVRENLESMGYNPSLINARFVKPMDEAMVKKLAENHKMIAVVEENVKTGGYGEQIMRYVSEHKLSVNVLSLSLPDEFIEHGSITELRRDNGIDSASLTERIIHAYKEL